jgi:leucine dehydrogenase
VVPEVAGSDPVGRPIFAVVPGKIIRQIVAIAPVIKLRYRVIKLPTEDAMAAIWELPDFDGHESVHFFTDEQTGLTAIISIHSTHLGPAAGGTRFWHYANPQDAITDALRLSRGMSYKNAMAGLAMGGGKAVILADALGTKTAAIIDSFAHAVEGLGGRYVTAQDVGMSAADMIAIAQHTRHVSGLPVAAGMAGGDPGPSTALGIFLGIKAAVHRKLGKASVEGVRIAIQGVGSVGGGVARHLAREGASLVLADRDLVKAQALATELGGTAVDADEILRTEADVLSPCALGAILNADTIPHLQCPIVAGAANNQLRTAADGESLRARGILYAPDYVINAGGIINVALEYLEKADQPSVELKIRGIAAKLDAIWDEADAHNESPAAVADRMAKALIGR